MSSAIAENLALDIQHELSIGIEGMTCGSCVMRVEKAIKAISGVSNASVNLATESACITFSAGVSYVTVQQAIEKAGYELVVDEVNLDVEGMSCASCVGRVEKALLKVDGVLDASVNLAAETARARMTGGVSADALIKALDVAGYKAMHHMPATDPNRVRIAAAPARQAARGPRNSGQTMPAAGLDQNHRL